MKWLLGLAFIAAGANHFVTTDFYVSIMPPYLPAHLQLVYVSGALEIAAGTMLLQPRLQAFGAWSIIAIAVAVFPANLHMALNAPAFPQFSEAALWLRLPLQALIIAWAYWFTRPPSGNVTIRE